VSQTELADRLGRRQSWMSKVETGERRIDVEELRQLCEALGVDFLRVIRKWLRTL
jgi:transcriptional regulator with XRE-family HTH domain